MKNSTQNNKILLLLPVHKEEKKTLYRSTSNCLLGGVCGGLAKFVKTDAILFRVLFAAFSLLGGIGIFIYLTLLLTLEPDSFRTNEVYFHRKEKERNFKVILGSTLILISLFELFNFFSYFTGINFYFFNNIIALSFFLIFLGIVIFIKRNNFNFVSKNEFSEFFRIKSRKTILGVCSGLNEYLQINLNITRIIWVLFSFATLGFGVIIYLLIALTTNYKEDSQLIDTF